MQKEQLEEASRKEEAVLMVPTAYVMVLTLSPAWLWTRCRNSFARALLRLERGPRC